MYKIKPMGDKGVLVQFEQIISEEVNGNVRSFFGAISDVKGQGIVEAIPAYSSVCVVYEPLISDYDKIRKLCESFLENSSAASSAKARVFEIPVLYGGEYGPDIEFVASSNGITQEEVVKIHTSKEYLIYMLGFAPGFCYLGGMDEKIATPRKDVPRQKITPGSVGIAGAQTGMYPIESPGGWQLIGRTPLKLYDPFREPPVYYNSGDYIKYVSVDQNEFSRIQALEDEGDYKWQINQGGRNG